MMTVMYNLEPRRDDADVILFDEMEEVNEVLFFLKGSHDIGYEFNSEKKYVLRFANANPIGAYGVTFN